MTVLWDGCKLQVWVKCCLVTGCFGSKAGRESRTHFQRRCDHHDMEHLRKMNANVEECLNMFIMSANSKGLAAQSTGTISLANGDLLKLLSPFNWHISWTWRHSHETSGYRKFSKTTGASFGRRDAFATISVRTEYTRTFTIRSQPNAQSAYKKEGDFGYNTLFSVAMVQSSFRAPRVSIRSNLWSSRIHSWAMRAYYILSEIPYARPAGLLTDFEGFAWHCASIYIENSFVQGNYTLE